MNQRECQAVIGGVLGALCNVADPRDVQGAVETIARHLPEMMAVFRSLAALTNIPGGTDGH